MEQNTHRNVIFEYSFRDNFCGQSPLEDKYISSTPGDNTEKIDRVEFDDTNTGKRNVIYLPRPEVIKVIDAGKKKEEIKITVRPKNLSIKDDKGQKTYTGE